MKRIKRTAINTTPDENGIVRIGTPLLPPDKPIRIGARLRDAATDPRPDDHLAPDENGHSSHALRSGRGLSAGN
ncbi:MAG TPA: hypothetical protein VHD87_08155 [Acidimicrobiales bacterium]|nr:hypothetical protein [Acidimicrobiales bacterium]